MDYSTLQHIVFRQFCADNAPADALSHCRVVFLHSQASRSLSQLTRSTDANRLFPSASRPLSPWQRLHGTPGEDVRMEPHHLHLPMSSLNGDLALDLFSSLPPSAGYHPQSYGHRQPHGLRSTQLNTLNTGPRQPQNKIVPPCHYGGSIVAVSH